MQACPLRGRYPWQSGHRESCTQQACLIITRPRCSQKARIAALERQSLLRSNGAKKSPKVRPWAGKVGRKTAQPLSTNPIIQIGNGKIPGQGRKNSRLKRSICGPHSGSFSRPSAIQMGSGGNAGSGAQRCRQRGRDHEGPRAFSDERKPRGVFETPAAGARRSGRCRRRSIREI
jgi:hypothetical protein